VGKNDLTDLEEKVVDLIEEGYARWKIAELLGMGESSIRSTIRALCERYDCPMYDLPQAIRGESKED
jgi:DNA-binding CsgD family transcriptional regulator